MTPAEVTAAVLAALKSPAGQEAIRAAAWDDERYGHAPDRQTLEQVLVAGANAAASLAKPQA
jgi:hypothetical protein